MVKKKHKKVPAPVSIVEYHDDRLCKIGDYILKASALKMMHATVKHNDALESLRVHELNDLIRANFITVYTEENGEINLKITEDGKMAIKEYKYLEQNTSYDADYKIRTILFTAIITSIVTTIASILFTLII